MSLVKLSVGKDRCLSRLMRVLLLTQIYKIVLPDFLANKKHVCFSVSPYL